MIRAAHEPTLPKPCTTTRVSDGLRPSAGAASLKHITTPRPVAASRPSEPPSEIGLPVTIAGVWPWSLPYSSIIQAITWAFVLTSGAGMSRVGPMHLLDLVDERPRDPLQLVAAELRRVAVDAALGAAERDPDDRRLPRHERGERADLVEVDLRVEAHAALVRPARGVVLDAVAGVDVDPPVGLPDRDLDLHLAVVGPQDRAHVVLEPEPVGRELEVVRDDLEVRDLRHMRRRRLVRRSRRLVDVRRRGHALRTSASLGPGPWRDYPSPVFPVRVRTVTRRYTRRARGHSSAGRAPALQAGGHRFDPGWLHRPDPLS